MEVPEKIYMPKELLSEEWTRHIEGEDVEYIHKDFFIEKVLRYLDVNFYFNNSHNRIECKVFDTKEEMLEDFKKYMEYICKR